MRTDKWTSERAHLRGYLHFRFETECEYNRSRPTRTLRNNLQYWLYIALHTSFTAQHRLYIGFILVSRTRELQAALARARVQLVVLYCFYTTFTHNQNHIARARALARSHILIIARACRPAVDHVRRRCDFNSGVRHSLISRARSRFRSAACNFFASNHRYESAERRRRNAINR